MQMTSARQLEPVLNVSRWQVKTNSKFLRLSKKNVSRLPSNFCIYRSSPLILHRMSIDRLISTPSKNSVNNFVMHLFELSNMEDSSLIKKITQTAVINIVFKRIFIELDVSYASQHTFSKVTVTIFWKLMNWYIYIVNNRATTSHYWRWH